jgi:hypothetical protein
VKRGALIAGVVAVVTVVVVALGIIIFVAVRSRSSHQPPRAASPRVLRTGAGKLAHRSNRLLIPREIAAAADRAEGPPALDHLFSRALCLGGNDRRCAEAQPLARRCDDGDAGGCEELMQLISQSPHAGLAVETLVARRACTRGSDRGCQRIAELDLWKALDHDPAARRSAETACDHGDGLACARLATSLGVNERAAALVDARNACAAGVIDSGGCTDVALWSDDPTTVEFMLREACNTRSANGCWLLGYFLLGECVAACIPARDPTGAAAAFKQACDLSAGHAACSAPEAE